MSSELPDLAAYVTKLRPYLEVYTHGTTTDNVRWFCDAETWWPQPHPDYKAGRVLAKALLAKSWMDASIANDAVARLLDAFATNFRYA